MKKHTAPFDHSEPHRNFWRDVSSYDEVLDSEFLQPLAEARQTSGTVPESLQISILKKLHWYFTVDMRERAPTVLVTDTMASAFHQRVSLIMSFIDTEILELPSLQAVETEVLHALFSYRACARTSTIAMDGFDHDQGLVRLSYYIHGDVPVERFVIGSSTVTPAYGKYRSCRYFHRELMCQRIVWLPIDGDQQVEVLLDGEPSYVAVGPQSFSARRATTAPPDADILTRVRERYPRGREGKRPLPWNWAGSKVRLLRALARLPWVRHKYQNAWVFSDRDHDADDNAEHLYRWVQANHPEINAWFLLSKSSPDWNRLSEEGVNLMPIGLNRKLLLLNADQVVASQPVLGAGGFLPAFYGDLMRWKFTYLRHGVQINDQSHWLNGQPLDRVIATSPAEHRATVGDHSPYIFTKKESRYTGAPRHDCLLAKAEALPLSAVDTILIFPTWRSQLTNDGFATQTDEERLSKFKNSVYARSWSQVINSDILKNMVTRCRKRLVFMPHPNAASFLDAFAVPSHVEVLTKTDVRIQDLLCRSAILITDYSSIAFEMAMLRRPVLYYQFDRTEFFSGDHNWRPGYFNYENEGFGPVVLTESDLMTHLASILSISNEPTRRYIDRMRLALPDNDGGACQRVFESILELRKPFY